MTPDEAINTRKCGGKGNKTTYDQYDCQTQSQRSMGNGPTPSGVLLTGIYGQPQPPNGVISHFQCNQGSSHDL